MTLNKLLIKSLLIEALCCQIVDDWGEARGVHHGTFDWGWSDQVGGGVVFSLLLIYFIFFFMIGRNEVATGESVTYRGLPISTLPVPVF